MTFCYKTENFVISGSEMVLEWTNWTWILK